jgi:hypothetical protein
MNHRFPTPPVVRSVVVAFALLGAAMAPAQWGLLDAAGTNAAGFVHVKSPSEFLGKIDALVAPLGLSSRMLLPTLGEKLFANPTLSGMDLAQPWVVVLLDPTRHARPFAFSFRSANAAQFVGGVGGTGLRAFALNPATAASRIKEFMQEISEFDREGYNAALEAGQNPDLQTFRRKETRRLYIGVSNRLIAGAGDRELVDRAIRATSSPPATLVEGDIVVHLQPRTLAAMIEGAETDGLTIPSTPGAPTGALPDFGEMADSAVQALQQLTAIENALELGAGRLRLRLGAEAADGTPLLDWAKRQSHGSFALTTFVPEESIGVVEYNLRFSPEELGAFIEMARAFEPVEEEPGAPLSIPEDLLRDWCATVKGPGLTAYLPNPPGQGGIRVVTVLEVESADRARELLRRAMQDEACRGWFTAARVPRKIPSELRLEVAQFQGYPVDRLGFAEPGDDADPLTRQTWDGLQAATGGSLVVYAACIPGYVIQTMGAQGLPTLNQTLLRLVENRGTRFMTLPRYRNHLGRAPAHAQVRFWFAGADYMKAMMTALPDEMPMPFDPKSLVGERKLDVSGHARIENETMVGEIVLPAGDIVGIAQNVMGSQFGSMMMSP